MAAYLFLIKYFLWRYCVRMSTDTPCIYKMLFRQIMFDTGILCDVTICHRNGYVLRSIQFLQLIIESPSHDSHKCSGPKSHSTMYLFRELDLSLMVSGMARFTSPTSNHQVKWWVIEYCAPSMLYTMGISQSSHYYIPHHQVFS